MAEMTNVGVRKLSEYKGTVTVILAVLLATLTLVVVTRQANAACPPTGCDPPDPNDNTPPTVTAFSPPNGSNNFLSGDNIRATFSETMESSTIDTSTFTLVRQGTSTSVAANVSYSTANDVATLNPTTGLVEGATYTATLKGGASGVTDLAGNKLASDVTWTFTVGDTSPPSVSFTSPAPSAILKGTVILSANASDNVGVARVRFLVSNVLVDQDTTAPYSVNWDSTTVGDGQKTFRVVAEDAQGTIGESTITATVDNATPKVDPLSLTPVKGATGMARNTNVSATFSEEMNGPSLKELDNTSKTFKIQRYNKKKKTWKTIPATISLSNTNKTATLDPYGATEPTGTDTLLAANKKFRAIITTGAEDVVGNPMPKQFIWTFTTGDN